LTTLNQEKNIHLYSVLAQTTKNEPQMQANLKTGHTKSEFHCTYRSTKHKHLSEPHWPIWYDTSHTTWWKSHVPLQARWCNYQPTGPAYRSSYFLNLKEMTEDTHCVYP